MSHEIALQSDGISHAFARTAGSDPAWHEACGIVANVVPDGSIPTAVAQAAGILDPIVKEVTFTHDGIPAGFCTVRTTDRKVIGASVGTDYTVVPQTRLMQIADRLQADGLVTCDTAMALRNGAVSVVNLRINGSTVEPQKGDKVTMNIALAQAFDGTMGVQALISSTRSVCANTLAVAFETAKSSWSARHTLNVEEAVKEIESQIRAALDESTRIGEQYKQLANTPFSGDDFLAFIGDVFPQVRKQAAAMIARTPLTAQRGRPSTLLPDLSARFAHGVGNKGKTAWDAYNAVTEFLTHTETRSPDARAIAYLGGASTDTAATALDLALAASDRILQVVRTDGTTVDVHTAAAEGLTIPNDGHSLLDYMLDL